MPAGFPFPLGLQHLKEPLGVYPGHIASPLWSLRKGSLEQQHPDWEPALPAWHDGNASLLPLPYGVQRCPHPRELLMEVGEVNSSPHPSRSGLSTPAPGHAAAEAGACCKAQNAGRWILGSLGALDLQPPWPQSQSTNSGSTPLGSGGMGLGGGRDCGTHGRYPWLPLGNRAEDMPKLPGTQRAGGQGCLSTRGAMRGPELLQEPGTDREVRTAQVVMGTAQGPSQQQLLPRNVPLARSPGEGRSEWVWLGGVGGRRWGGKEERDS